MTLWVVVPPINPFRRVPAFAASPPFADVSRETWASRAPSIHAGVRAKRRLFHFAQPISLHPFGLLSPLVGPPARLQGRARSLLIMEQRYDPGISFNVSRLRGIARGMAKSGASLRCALACHLAGFTRTGALAHAWSVLFSRRFGGAASSISSISSAIASSNISASSRATICPTQT